MSFIRPLLRSSRSNLIKLNNIQKNGLATGNEMLFTFASQSDLLYNNAKNVKCINCTIIIRTS
jgi:hypothetical protein